MIISICSNALKFGNPDKNEIGRNFFVYEPILSFLLLKMFENVNIFQNDWNIKNHVKYIYKANRQNGQWPLNKKNNNKIDLFDDIFSM